MTPAPAHPWRRTARTIFAWMTGIAPMVPLIVDAGDFSAATPGLAGALAISSAVTRILALPQVESFLRAYVPWLAASDVQADQVVAHVVEGKVVAGEASLVPTGEVITMPSVESEARKPARRKPAKPRQRGDIDVVTLLVVVLVVILILVLVDRI